MWRHLSGTTYEFVHQAFTLVDSVGIQEIVYDAHQRPYASAGDVIGVHTPGESVVPWDGCGSLPVFLYKRTANPPPENVRFSTWNGCRQYSIQVTYFGMYSQSTVVNSSKVHRTTFVRNK